MKERPILFSGPMVRAIREARKTQTRRVVKEIDPDEFVSSNEADNLALCCPYGAVGDRLWVRETWQGNQGDIRYGADGDSLHGYNGWRPSIFMPRWASRITLEVTGVRVERVQEISEEDAQAEGVAHRCDYKVVWDAINGKKYPWSSNPWVWVIEFKRAVQ